MSQLAPMKRNLRRYPDSVERLINVASKFQDCLSKPRNRLSQMSQTLEVKRSKLILQPDQSRVLLRPFNPGDSARVNRIIDRVLSMPDKQTEETLDALTRDFAERHHGLHERFQKRFEQVCNHRDCLQELSEQKRFLIGSCFLAEYSLESAALFNPSIVPDADQTNLPKGALRFVLSLRATGEGHISSITFRTGVIGPDNEIEINKPKGFLTEARQVPNSIYEKDIFTRKLEELGLNCEFSNRVADRLAPSFNVDELNTCIHAELDHERDAEGVLHEDHEVANGIKMLAQSNYEVQFEHEQNLSQRILFPATPAQSNGIEDARFVRFQNPDESFVYYATFTAYDGKVIMPELIETTDFLRFRFSTLNGPAAQNKGMAMFPRKINGRYAMLARHDNESIYISYSDNHHFWNESKLLFKPEQAWELIQIGNCGSPIETESGWLVLSHGVGPMRTYCIGAFLLDLDDPSKVIGRLNEPLLQPNEDERKGYVPNVVYTCGALVHNDVLFIPYGLADHATGFASVPVENVLAAMQANVGAAK